MAARGRVCLDTNSSSMRWIAIQATCSTVALVSDPIQFLAEESQYRLRRGAKLGLQI